ncbi:uncharacterized protein NEMAJ01_0037 [Nematocida major]|uniref:uncharacterized protein n=1 Tax=Nematocida major TaxID=1912982 RepID=UPI0020086120|nr:uncharacterized protein NEMAJ01_0037 [Nematocida major]KAH9385141.1 hypothetical protein NEMAJ01_0037 [Nematocida major]
MKKSIESLLEKYQSFGIYEEKKGAIARYSDKHRKYKDGTIHIITAIHSRSEDYPNELVESGFGHGEKYKTKGASEEHIFTTSIDSEVEESEESESNPPSENEDMENDYMENHYEDDDDETPGESEDVI